MADEKVTVEVVGVDKLTGVMGGISRTLKDMFSIAGGIYIAKFFDTILSSLTNLAKEALRAYEVFDRVRFGLKELALADNINKIFEDGSKVFATWEAAAADATVQGQKLLDWVIQMGLKSPFSFEDVNLMFRLTRAYGFTGDEIKGVTKKILDFAAGTGFGAQVLERLGLALGQVRQRGRLAGEEIRQLINVGIPVREIVSKTMGVTTAAFEKLLRKGLIPGDLALQSIFDWMERFTGASERAVRTWHGLIINFQDLKALGLVKFFDNLAKALTPVMNKLFDLFASPQFMGKVIDWGTKMGEAIAPVVDWFIRLIDNFGNMSYHWKQMVSGSEDVITALGFIAFYLGLISADEFGDALSFIGDLKTYFGDLSDSIGRVVDSWVQPIMDAIPLWLEDMEAIGVATIEAFAPVIQRIADALVDMSESTGPAVIGTLTRALDGLAKWWASGGATDAAQVLEFLVFLAGTTFNIGILGVAAAIETLTNVLSGDDTAKSTEAAIALADAIGKIPAQAQGLTLIQRAQAGFVAVWGGFYNLVLAIMQEFVRRIAEDFEMWKAQIPKMVDAFLVELGRSVGGVWALVPNMVAAANAFANAFTGTVTGIINRFMVWLNGKLAGISALLASLGIDFTFGPVGPLPPGAPKKETKRINKGYAQFGMDMVVPPGFYKDDYTVGFSSGERVVATPGGAAAAGGGKNIFLTVNNPLDEQVVLRIIREFMGGA